MGAGYLKSTNYETTLVLSRSKKAYKIRGERKKCQNIISEYTEIPYSLIILFGVMFVSVKWNLMKYYNLYSTLWWVIIFFLLIWNQLRSNCFINLIIKSFYKLSLLWVLINRSFSTGLNLCPVDNTIGFPNTYQPDIKWIIRWTARTINLLNRPGAGRHSILRLLYWGPLFRRNQSRDDRHWLEDDLKGQPFKS